MAKKKKNTLVATIPATPLSKVRNKDRGRTAGVPQARSHGKLTSRHRPGKKGSRRAYNPAEAGSEITRNSP